MENLKTEKHSVKTVAEMLAENPNHLDNIILDNKMNLYHNADYFFKQADVPALLAFLGTKDIKIEMNGDKVLEKSVKALSHFLYCYNDYKRAFDRIRKLDVQAKELKTKQILE